MRIHTRLEASLSFTRTCLLKMKTKKGNKENNKGVRDCLGSPEALAASYMG